MRTRATLTPARRAASAFPPISSSKVSRLPTICRCSGRLGERPALSPSTPRGSNRPSPGPGRALRCEFEYRRGGTLAYLAAWDVHHANLFGRVEEKTGIEPFGRLVEEVMKSEPYASARRVFWIVDNGSSHAGGDSI